MICCKFSLFEIITVLAIVNTNIHRDVQKSIEIETQSEVNEYERPHIILLNKQTICFCVIIIISTWCLFTGALELEGVEVQVQLDDKKDIKDLIPKKVKDHSYNQTSLGNL